MQNRIRELREERGMNQDALAGLVGVSQQKISKVERNTESLGIDLLIEISDYFLGLLPIISFACQMRRGELHRTDGSDGRWMNMRR